MLNSLKHSVINDPEDVDVTPILYFKPKNGNSKDQTLAAAILNMGKDREIFTFFLEFSPTSLTSTILNHLWISWASRNLIGGHRKVYFSPQIENVFLSTRIIDETLEKKGFNITNFEDALTKKFRASPEDFRYLIEYVKALHKNGQLNKGSQIRIELAFNGKGILDAQTPYTLYRRMGADLYTHEPQDHTEPHAYKFHQTNEDNEENTDNNNNNNNNSQPIAVIKGQLLNASEPKSEKEIWLEEVTKYWDTRHATYVADELFTFFQDVNNRKEFFWFSNTYSNNIMLNATKVEIKDQILRNIEIAMHLGLISKELTNSEPWWSKGSISTRGSLGYTEDLVQETLTQYNIHYGFGNKHREDIINSDNHYLPWRNEEGTFYVIPRDKRLAFRWASSPLQAIWLYKNFYANKFASNHTFTIDDMNYDTLEDWNQILEMEADEAVHALLNLKHDPFVFNQANIRVHPTESSTANNSILAQWLRATIKKFNSYVFWPLVSIKSDFLASDYVLRDLQKECGVDFSYTYNDTHILSIQATSIKACKVPVTVTDDIKKFIGDKTFTYEKYGDDPLTVWIDLPGEGVTKIIELSPALSFNDRTIVQIEGGNSLGEDSGAEGDDKEEEEVLNPFMLKVSAVHTKPPQNKKIKIIKKVKVVNVIKNKKGEYVTKVDNKPAKHYKTKAVIKKVVKIKPKNKVQLKANMENILKSRSLDEEEKKVNDVLNEDKVVENNEVEEKEKVEEVEEVEEFAKIEKHPQVDKKKVIKKNN